MWCDWGVLSTGCLHMFVFGSCRQCTLECLLPMCRACAEIRGVVVLLPGNLLSQHGDVMWSEGRICTQDALQTGGSL
jgi:hypothetical protein